MRYFRNNDKSTLRGALTDERHVHIEIAGFVMRTFVLNEKNLTEGSSSEHGF